MTTNDFLQFIQVIGVAIIFLSIRPIIVFAVYYFKLLLLKDSELSLVLPSSNEKTWLTISSGRIGRRQFALRTSIIGVLIVAAIQIGVFFEFVPVALSMVIPLIVVYIIQMIKRWNDLHIVSSSWSCFEIVLAVIFWQIVVSFLIVRFIFRLTTNEGSKKDNKDGKTRYPKEEIVIELDCEKETNTSENQSINQSDINQDSETIIL